MAPRVVDDAHRQADASASAPAAPARSGTPRVRRSRRSIVSLRRLRHAIAFADRNIADDPGGRRGHAVVAEIGARRADLLLHRAQLRFGRFQRVRRRGRRPSGSPRRPSAASPRARPPAARMSTIDFALRAAPTRGSRPAPAARASRFPSAARRRPRAGRTSPVMRVMNPSTWG